MPDQLTPNGFQGKVLRPNPPNPDAPLTREQIPDKVWKMAEDVIGADGRLKESRTVRRTAFAIGQVAKLALSIAAGQTEAKSGSTYDMPDYEGEHGRIPRTPSGGGGGSTPGGGGDPSTPVPPPSSGYIPKNALDVALAVRARYGAYLDELSPARLAFLRELARALGPDAGLLDKPTGKNNSGFSVDIIVFKNGEHFDVVNGTTTQAQWSYVGRVDPSRWRAP